ncbi:MAG: PP2C family protein-serine/threonine phosphatase [Candidatus Dormibacteria bacterium]
MTEDAGPAGTAVVAGPWRLEGAASTARGPVRQENQDAFRLVGLEGIGLGLILADGMGGHSGGGEAAVAAVTAAAERLADPGGGEGRLGEVMALANTAVGEVRRQLGGNPGTTMIAALISADRLSLAHAGDSRAYLVRGGSAVQLTSDHSVTGERVRAGTLDPEAARHDPRRNYVTRALLGDPVEPDLSETPIAAGDVLVLCSDGLWEPIADAEIARLAGGGASPGEAARRLVEAALAAGSTDNVTAVVARVDPR